MNIKDKMINVPILGKYFLKAMIKKEGGEKESNTLRRYTENKFKVHVDKYTYGSCFEPSFNTGGTVVIGRYCSFGTDIHYYGANHPVQHAVMTPYFYNKKFSGLEVKDVDRHTLYIGNDVWIGHGVTIVSSCHNIGNGAVLASGAVVTKDVPPYAIVGGVPAKVLKYRFDDAVQRKIEKCKWWKLTPLELYRFYHLIGNPQQWADAVDEYFKRLNAKNE